MAHVTKLSAKQTFSEDELVEKERIDFLGSIPFFAVHILALSVFFVSFSWAAVAFCIFSYALRMFGITAGFHRYFAHRAFQTNRAMQFVLGLLGTFSSQRGPLWWAAHHRHHHIYSDKPKDIHSPLQRGFWWSHMGWILCKRYEETNLSLIKDFDRYPEIHLLNRYHYIVSIVYAVLCFGVGVALGQITGVEAYTGWSFLVWGYFLSTVFLYHGTFFINSLAHVWGTKRFAVPDESRNNFLLAIVTLGEGWHNNHHRFPTSVSQGLRWWEIDISHMVLCGLRIVKLVKNLKRPTRTEIAQAQRYRKVF